MKHLYTLSLLLLALLIPATALSHDFEVDGIYYNINVNNKVSVTYRGSSYNSYFNEYSGSVTIPATVTYGGTTYSVTSIGDDAFDSCSGLTSVTIPNSVTSIGRSAFAVCSGLTSIDIPNSVTAIGDWAFTSCRGLTSIIIPNSVTSIGYHAFYNCSSLTSISIGNSATSIGSNAFYGCSGLTSVTIPNSVTYIEDHAFYGCSGLTSITIGSSVTSIGDSAFDDCYSLETVKCIGTVPPVMASTDCFSTAAYNRATLLVPRNTEATYTAADYWYKFAHIEGWGSAGRGDIDGDGEVSIRDVTTMIDAILNGNNEGVYFESADLNNNGRLDIGDVTTIIDMLLNGE